MNEWILVIAIAAMAIIAAEGLSKKNKDSYDQAIHDCQQNTFDSDTIITFKPIEK